MLSSRLAMLSGSEATSARRARACSTLEQRQPAERVHGSMATVKRPPPAG